MRVLQWTGQRPRSSRKSSCGGPSAQSSRSITSWPSRSVAVSGAGVSGGCKMTDRTAWPTGRGARLVTFGVRLRDGRAGLVVALRPGRRAGDAVDDDVPRLPRRVVAHALHADEVRAGNGFGRR